MSESVIEMAWVLLLSSSQVKVYVKMVSLLNALGRYFPRKVWCPVGYCLQIPYCPLHLGQERRQRQGRQRWKDRQGRPLKEGGQDEEKDLDQGQDKG